MSSCSLPASRPAMACPMRPSPMKPILIDSSRRRAGRFECSRAHAEARGELALGACPLGRAAESAEQLALDPLELASDVIDDVAGLQVLRQHVPRVRFDLEVRRQDRKSTRLNSSHVKISYAVF